MTRPRLRHDGGPTCDEYGEPVPPLPVCGSCRHLGDRRPERRVGYCLVYRVMMPSVVAIECEAYEEKEGKAKSSAVPEVAQTPPADPGEVMRERFEIPQAKPSVRDVSIEAYRAIEYSGKLTKQQRLVLDVLQANPQRDFTRQELAHELGLGINVICGRVNELMREPLQLVVETGRRDCRITGQTANPVRVRVAQLALV